MTAAMRTAALFVCIVVASSAADDSAKTKFQTGASVPANVGFSTSISPDGRAQTLVFDDMWVAIESVRKGPRTVHGQTVESSKVVTFQIPYTTEQRSLQMNVDVRGFAAVDPSAHARLVVCAGNATHVVDLAPEDAKTAPKEAALKGQSKAGIQVDQPDRKFGDFYERIPVTVQVHAAKPSLQLTLFLLVEHDTDVPDGGAALLAVDSLDLEISNSGKSTF